MIAAGNLSGSITVTAVDNCNDEDDETVIVDVVGVTNGTESGTQQRTITITDGTNYPVFETPVGTSGLVVLATNYGPGGKFDPATEPSMSIAQFYENIVGLTAANAVLASDALRTAAIARYNSNYGVDLSGGPTGNWILLEFVVPADPAGYRVDRISGLRINSGGGLVYEIGYIMLAAGPATIGDPWAASVGFPGGFLVPQGTAVFYGEHHLRGIDVVCDDGSALTPAPNMTIGYQSEEPVFSNVYDQSVYGYDITSWSCDTCDPAISGTGVEHSVRQLYQHGDGDVHRYGTNVITFVP